MYFKDTSKIFRYYIYIYIITKVSTLYILCSVLNTRVYIVEMTIKRDDLKNQIEPLLKKMLFCNFKQSYKAIISLFHNNCYHLLVIPGGNNEIHLNQNNIFEQVQNLKYIALFVW